MRFEGVHPFHGACLDALLVLVLLQAVCIKDCDVYTYQSDLETDPFGKQGWPPCVERTGLPPFGRLCGHGMGGVAHASRAPMHMHMHM